jgi:hypothetical protein
MKAPFDMPVSGMALQQFEPLRVDYGAPEAGGRIGGVQAGAPLWQGVWTIGNIGAAKSDELRAFLASLRGGTRRFLGRDLARPYPKAYATTGFAGLTRAGGGSFDGTATSWSETITADGDAQFTLHGLPAGFAMTIGDYIGFRWVATETRRRRADLARAGARDRSEDRRRLRGAVWHHLRTAFAGVRSADRDLLPEHPKAVMALVGDKSNLDAIDRRLAVKGGTITGIQDLRA